MVRRHEKASNYRTLERIAIKREAVKNLSDLANYMRDHLDEISRSDLIKISVALNNLILDIEK